MWTLWEELFSKATYEESLCNISQGKENRLDNLAGTRFDTRYRLQLKIKTYKNMSLVINQNLKWLPPTVMIDNLNPGKIWIAVLIGNSYE